MEATVTSPAGLVGKTFDCDFGSFVPRLTFRTADEIRVQAKLGDVNIDQTVRADVSGVRQDVFIVSWVEDNGNFVVQLQDHANGVVHNHARLADGQVFRAEGRLQPVGA
ncbi:hypothetical protein ABMA32_20175 [Mesorhizobium sp. VNQ89]|uniref:MoaF-related domain-containing protein n=1 Tax=Mesorhizobium quangtriensis TaxID=3157709 RepID=UPI0032B707A8